MIVTAKSLSFQMNSSSASHPMDALYFCTLKGQRRGVKLPSAGANSSLPLETMERLLKFLVPAFFSALYRVVGYTICNPVLGNFLSKMGTLVVAFCPTFYHKWCTTNTSLACCFLIPLHLVTFALAAPSLAVPPTTSTISLLPHHFRLLSNSTSSTQLRYPLHDNKKVEVLRSEYYWTRD